MSDVDLNINIQSEGENNLKLLKKYLKVENLV